MHHTYRPTPGSRVLRLSKRPNLQKIAYFSFSCSKHEPLSYNQQYRPTQKHRKGIPGCAVGH
jgi:hypothetical protein